LGIVQTTWQLLLVYTFFGIGFAASGLLPATTLIARWFAANRAKALSVTSTGLSLGGVAITPVCASLVESQGLSEMAPYLAVTYLLGIVPIAFFLRSSPSELGLKPDGESTSDTVVAETSIEFRAALRHPFFWLLSLAYLFVMLAQVGGIAHQYGLLSERVTTEQSRYLIALLPLFSIVGRLAGGWILDMVVTKTFTLCMMVLQAVSLGLVSIAENVWLLGIGLALFGVTVGNLLMLQPLIIAEVYGLKDYSRLYSWSNLLTMFGVAGGPVLIGLLFVTTGSYQLPYLVVAVMGFMATFVYILAQPPEKPESKV
jgi:MFS family permease